MAESTSCGAFSGARENVTAPELNLRRLDLARALFLAPSNDEAKRNACGKLKIAVVCMYVIEKHAKVC